ncbi:hypothetical protein CAOG_04312 [Capsaspora owczarzaki ATCC 30864]|uniref:Uncharacterized protein n=1 Tax=Capsaspora owczarzaki (strain ATCC 30864) TaxID=595528 RepID=A0A0D2WPW1_CAPO3|nr:hypothetical protein CAOG_04312 [Capsaspora owczarzaki ATCC 30864]KJE93540.1 hypothetical protein CAOG_004312 [Capsaspora owczarzaki ATCC 30864]|eukprot:XP_004348140.1 hypothetical protein CAOG_04312 [Capsaspora owczarzaki ATCC 30864]
MSNYPTAIQPGANRPSASSSSSAAAARPDGSSRSRELLDSDENRTHYPHWYSDAMDAGPSSMVVDPAGSAFNPMHATRTRQPSPLASRAPPPSPMSFFQQQLTAGALNFSSPRGPLASQTGREQPSQLGAQRVRFGAQSSPTLTALRSDQADRGASATPSSSAALLSSYSAREAAPGFAGSESLANSEFVRRPESGAASGEAAAVDSVLEEQQLQRFRELASSLGREGDLEARVSAIESCLSLLATDSKPLFGLVARVTAMEEFLAKHYVELIAHIEALERELDLLSKNAKP